MKLCNLVAEQITGIKADVPGQEFLIELSQLNPEFVTNHEIYRAHNGKITFQINELLRKPHLFINPENPTIIAK